MDVDTESNLVQGSMVLNKCEDPFFQTVSEIVISWPWLKVAFGLEASQSICARGQAKPELKGGLQWPMALASNLVGCSHGLQLWPQSWEAAIWLLL